MWRLAVIILIVAAVVVSVALAESGDQRKPVDASAGDHDLFRGAAGPRLVVWAVGDGATGTPVARRLARRIAADDPARVLYLGDVYETGTPDEFRRNFGGVYGRLVRRMLPTPGNHEWPNHEQGYDRYWADGATGAPPWYGVRLGTWDVMSLNTEADHGSGSRQLRWLQRRLRRPAPCRLAFWHRPRYSAGSHGDQPDVAPLWRAVAGRVPLVLSGHDHNTQRLRPVGGTTQVVAGAGGRGLYALDAGDPRLEYANQTAHMAVRLVLSARSAQARIVTISGRVVDRFAVRCDP